MRYKVVLPVVISTLISLSLWAENAPNPLYENASAIVKKYDAAFTQSDNNNAVYRLSATIVILNKRGERASYFSKYNDKFRTMSYFSGTIKDALGNTIKRVKKGDLNISSFSEGSLATDDVDITYNFQSPSYPYTIEYTYEEKWKNGIIGYPPFLPVSDFGVSVDSARLAINLPTDKELRYKNNFGIEVQHTQSKTNTYIFTLSGFKAVEQEPWAPSEILPYALAAPNDFCYDSFCGNLSDWTGYGVWTSNLLKDRDVISPQLIEKLKQITNGLENDREKVKAIYEYLQNNTRYVSIQFGIGGLRPEPASVVEKTGFGDCKGLSNFMKAMLKAVNIPAYYCEIYHGNRKTMFKDFASAGQANHAILLVPLKNDSIWLECTSSTLPFGYVHEDIAGHDALVITDKGGKLCKLPVYTPEQNRNTNKLIVDVDDKGSASGSIYFKETLSTYENVYHLYRSNDREKLVKHIQGYIRMPSLQIGNITTKENKSDLPSVELDATFTAKDFANVTGNRLFIPVCPLNKGSFTVTASERKLDIEFSSPYLETDTIVFNIPPLYVPESLPGNLELTTPYGSLTTTTEYKNNQIIYVQNIEVFAGKYDKSEYLQIKKFFGEINNGIKRKLVIKSA
ncbi:DUF3857 domain-containing protein [Viscerimonas tarda]